MKKSFVTTAILVLVSISIIAQCKIDYSNYHVVFLENFNTYNTTKDMKNLWRFYYPWGDGDSSTCGRTLIGNCNEDVYYDESQVSIIPGGTGQLLRLSAELMSDPITIACDKNLVNKPVNCDPQNERYSLSDSLYKTLHYKSGMIYSTFIGDNQICNMPEVGYAYGIFEISCKLSKESTWPSFWLWGKNEIDVFEGSSEKGPRRISNNIHDYSNPYTSCQGVYNKLGWDDFADDFHLFSVAWTPDKITFFLNGREIRTVNNDLVPIHNCSLAMIVNLAIVSYVGISSAHIDIDYIKVWKANNPEVQNDFKSKEEWMNHDITAYSSGISNVNYDFGSIAINSINQNKVFFRGLDSKMYCSTLNNNTWNTVCLYTGISATLVKGFLAFNPVHNIILYQGYDDRIQFYSLASSNFYHGYIDDNWNTQVYCVKSSISVDSNGDIIYQGTDNKIQKFYFLNGDWVHEWLPHVYGQNIGNINADYVKGDVVVNELNDVFYKGFDDRIQIFWQDGNGIYHHAWVDDYWNTSAYLVSEWPGSIIIGNNNDIYYVGQDDKMHRFYWQNDWYHEWIPYVYGNPNLGYLNGDKVKGNIGWDDISKRIVYLGYDGRIQFFAFINNNWEHRWLDDYWNTDEFTAYNADNWWHWYISPSIKLSAVDNTYYYSRKDGHLSYFAWESCEKLNPPCYDNNNPIITNLNKRSNLKSNSDDYINDNKIVNNRSSIMSIRIFPNPVFNELSIDIKYKPTIENGQRIVAYLFTNLGQLIKQNQFFTNIILDISDLNPGIYFLVIKDELSGEMLYSEKIIKFGDSK